MAANFDGLPSPASGTRDEVVGTLEVGFTLRGSEVTVAASNTPVEAGAETRARELVFRIGQQLAQVGPAGWTRLDAVFALTVTDRIARVRYSGSDGRVLEVAPEEKIVDWARSQRELIAELEGEPWWRMILGLSADGEITVDFDDGDEPFPADQMLSPESYLLDIEVFPRNRLPLWLAAYIADDGGQQRPAKRVGLVAAPSSVADMHAELADELPPLRSMRSRWATLAAVAAAVRSQFGPRMLPSMCWFEGESRSGSTVFVLPDGSAVLSGGLGNDLELAAAYRGLAAMPQLYRGAPWWVADQVLNARAQQGTLSFCFWWDKSGWYRGDSPRPCEVAAALPAIWTTGAVLDRIVEQVAHDGDGHVRVAAEALLSAADGGRVEHRLLLDLLADRSDSDVDGAYYEYFLAGLAA
ncbi:hypothetical protein ACQP2U_24425 [Nocardia sp. CA-084685]|uniref:hypothetical protein n=1 Tax=Nocardia sp. CA-084685 TaxID=3239970 RepID=UPI003D99220A